MENYDAEPFLLLRAVPDLRFFVQGAVFDQAISSIPGQATYSAQIGP